MSNNNNNGNNKPPPTTTTTTGPLPPQHHHHHHDLPTSPVWDDVADETHPLLQSPRSPGINDDTYDSGDAAFADYSSRNRHRRIRSDYQHRRRRHRRQYRQQGSIQQPPPSSSSSSLPPHHHRRLTSLSQLFESIGNGLEDIAEDVIDAAVDAKTTFAHQLATPADRYFMDMTMTRSLSLLPESIPDFFQESTAAVTLREEEEEEIEAMEVIAPPLPPEAIPIGRYVALLGAVLAVSSNGTALSLLYHVPPPLKLYWRMTATATLLFPMCIAHAWTMYNNNNNKVTTNTNTTIANVTTIATCNISNEATENALLLSRYHDDIENQTNHNNNNNIVSDCNAVNITQPYNESSKEVSSSSTATTTNLLQMILLSFFPDTLTHGQWMNFAAAVLCFTIHTLLFFAAFALTSIGNAVIFANSQALLLILGKAAMGQAVLCLEGMGVLVAMTGAIMCSLDTERQDNDPSMTTTAKIIYPNPLLGDIAAIGAAISGVGYLTFAKAVRPHMSVTLFMFLVMFCGSLLVLLYMIVAGYNITFSNDPYTGLFGWITPKQGHIYILLHVALICNVCGTMGFVRAMEYFDNLIIAMATLLEPMIASLIAAAVGVGVLPGLQGWLGNWLVVAGTMAVLYPSLSTDGDDDIGH